MNKFIPALLLGLFLCLLCSCPNNGTYISLPSPSPTPSPTPFPSPSPTPFHNSGITTSIETPQTAPASGIWLLLEIYTIDDITPEGDITAEIYDFSAQSTIYLTLSRATTSTVPGTTLHQIWLQLPCVDTDPYSIRRIYNSAGKGSLAMGQEARHEIIYINSDYTYLWIINGSLKQYNTRGIIRHWEDSPPGVELEISGNVMDEQGNPYSITFEIKPMHQFGQGIWGGFSIELDIPVTGAFSFTYNKLRPISAENLLPFEDFFELRTRINFYSSNLPAHKCYYYHTFENINLGDVVMAANRIISFNWVYAANGVFTGSEIVYTAQINTTSYSDYSDFKLRQSFSDSFNDPRLKWLNSYDLDDDNSMWADLKAGYDSNLGGVKFSSYYSQFSNLGAATLPLAADLSGGLPLPVDEIMLVAGDVYALHTSNGGTALVEVTDIHTMTQAEMNAFSAAGTRMPDNRIRRITGNRDMWF